MGLLACSHPSGTSKGRNVKGDQITIKLPQGHRIYWALNWGLSLSWEGMPGMETSRSWGEGGRQGCSSLCQQPTVSWVISHPPFPFPCILGMLSRNSPYPHFIDESTNAQEREVTCPRWLDTDPSSLAQYSFLYSLLHLEKSQTWSQTCILDKNFT